MYKYAVIYTFGTDDNRNGTGRAFITSDQPLNTEANLKSLEQKLEEGNYLPIKTLMITNIIPLED